MKKYAAALIILMLLTMSTAVLINIFSAEASSSEAGFFENIEDSVSISIPFREEFSELMDGIRYLSGVRHFGDIYIGSEGSLLKEIERPSSRTFSVAKNYILSFAEKNQIKPYFMLVPTSSAILQQEIDSYARQELFNQRNMINRMYSEFDGRVRTTDIYQTLYDHRGEYIYYHTEDMPTSLGGYYIYGELCSRLGIEQNTMDSFAAAYVARGFYGNLATGFFKNYADSDFVSLYEYVGSERKTVVEKRYSSGISRISNSIFIYDEKGFEDKTDMIFGGMAPVMDISVSQSFGERNSILIFGDESAKSWLPFLSSSFGRITFVDLNSATEELLSSISVKDYDLVLFAYSTASFVSEISFEKLEFLK